jgi:cytoskeleton protein RodZ
MGPVGDDLREIRTRRGLSLTDVGRATRVASRYLEALESNEFSVLPAPVFTRGFIRAYCQLLGVSPEDTLARYERHLGAAAPATPAAPARPVTTARATTSTPAPSESEPRSRSAVLVSFVLLVILGMALFAMALMTQRRDEFVAERHEPTAAERPAAPPEETPSTVTATPPPPPTSTVAVAASTPPAPPASVAPPRSTAPTTAPSEAVRVTPQSWLPEVQAATGGLASPYRLIARVSEPTWIRVRTEEGRLTEETVPAGEVREWTSNRPFVLTLGNAGGVTLELNGRTLPPLGPRGLVIGRIVLPPQ